MILLFFILIFILFSFSVIFFLGKSGFLFSSPVFISSLFLYFPLSRGGSPFLCRQRKGEKRRGEACFPTFDTPYKASAAGLLR